MWKISLVVHPISRNPSPLASNLTVPLWMRSQLLYFKIFVVCNHAFSKWNFAQRMYCSRHWMPTQRRRQTSSNQLWNSYVFVILQEPFLIRLPTTKSSKVNLQCLPRQSFETIGVGRWIDDEVINYFMEKWCSKSCTTLGFNTWFAGKFLFEENLCLHAKSGIFTMADEKKIQRWCRAAEVKFYSICKTKYAESKLESSKSSQMGTCLHSHQWEQYTLVFG